MNYRKSCRSRRHTPESPGRPLTSPLRAAALTGGPAPRAQTKRSAIGSHLREQMKSKWRSPRPHSRPPIAGEVSASARWVRGCALIQVLAVQGTTPTRRRVPSPRRNRDHLARMIHHIPGNTGRPSGRNANPVVVAIPGRFMCRHIKWSLDDYGGGGYIMTVNQGATMPKLKGSFCENEGRLLKS
jgi:hypothetical protein